MLWGFGLSLWVGPGKTGALICITQIPPPGTDPRTGQTVRARRLQGQLTDEKWHLAVELEKGESTIETLPGQTQQAGGVPGI